MYLRVLAPLMLVMFSLFLEGSSAAESGATPPNPNLKTSAAGVQYYLSLPKNWKADSTWPILVSIDGSGHNFSGNFGSFVGARGDRPFIIVTPCVSSNGKDPADYKAVIEIVKEVQKSSSGQPKFFITGFSAGGHVAWQLIFNHPDLLAGAAPAAANFRSRFVENVSKAPERIQLPIHAFIGEKDGFKTNLMQQWEDAKKLALNNGYENLKLTEIPGQAHTAFYKEVTDFFASLLPK